MFGFKMKYQYKNNSKFLFLFPYTCWQLLNTVASWLTNINKILEFIALFHFLSNDNSAH